MKPIPSDYPKGEPMPTLAVDGGRMHYVDEGPRDAPVVLLVHGTPSSSHEYRYVIGALKEHFRCIAPDLIGFGASEKPPTWSYGLKDHTQNLERLVAHLGIDRFHLIVHDFGGVVGLPLALAAPARIRSLTVLNSWMWDLGLDPAAARAQKHMLSPLVRFLYLNLNFSPRILVKMAWGRHRPLTRDLHRQYMAPFPDRAARHGTLAFARSLALDGAYLEALWAQRGKLRDLPALVIWGMADGFIKTLHLERWKTVFARAEILEIPAAGHFPQDEAGPDVVAPAVAAFLLKAPRSAVRST